MFRLHKAKTVHHEEATGEEAAEEDVSRMPKSSHIARFQVAVALNRKTVRSPVNIPRFEHETAHEHPTVFFNVPSSIDSPNVVDNKLAALTQSRDQCMLL